MFAETINNNIMAATHPNVAVMHCTALEPVEVYNLANNIITAGMYVNTGTFTTIPVPIGTTTTGFLGAVTKLGTLIASAKGNSDNINARDTQAVLVHDTYLKPLLAYTNTTANHSLTIINLSGFDHNIQPTKQGIPPTPVISNISDKKRADGEAKINLVRNKKKAAGTATAPKIQGLKYSARITTAPATATSVWITELSAVSSTDLILTGLVKLVENAVQVRAEHGKLKSPWSAAVNYASRTSAPGTTTTTPTTTPTTGTTGTTPATG
jgi:hypothetical protein